MIILVTGGSGFLGRHLIRELLDRYQDAEIRTISRSGNAIQRLLVECHNERLTPIVGDIRDVGSVRYAMRNVDTVIHLAAMKHVGLGETYPAEAIMTNVTGTKILLDSFCGNTFIGMSTDKAVEPAGCYGATKLLMERLILDQAKREEGKRFMAVRTGNIFGSTSSVIEIWRQQIMQSNEIDVTDLKMTKFFIGVKTLVDFIIETMESGKNGGVYIPYQKALTLADLAKAVIDSYGNQATRMRSIGIRPGEKPHEILFAEGEKVCTQLTSNLSSESPRLTVEEIEGWLKESTC